MTQMQQQKPGSSTGQPIASAPDQSRTIRLEDLPESIRRVLTKVAAEDREFIETVLCRQPFMYDLVLAFRLADAMWHAAAPKEHRIGADRITGTEMDKFRDRVGAAVKEILSIAMDLAARARLTKIQQNYTGILARYGFKVAKSEAKALAKAPTKEKPAAAAATPAPTAVADAAVEGDAA